jgi:hypothetical protein
MGDLTRLVGTDQQIAVRVGIEVWGYDRIDVPPELQSEHFDMVLKTHRDPPGYFGICKLQGHDSAASRTP